MKKVLVLLFCLVLPIAAHGQGTVRGVVRDATGLAVPGAVIFVQTSSGIEQHGVTASDGRFELARGIPKGATLVVRAGGFAEKTQAVADASELEVVLLPARLFDSVTVTPTRTEQRLGDIAASTHVIDQEEIRHSPAMMADDVLRSIPTFSLFR